MNKINIALEWAMRVGYAARGVVYVILGALAAFAAVNGGEAEGTKGALGYLVQQPFGRVLLLIVAAGLFTYSLWRFLDAGFDLEDEGHDAHGVATRTGQFMAGASYAVLGLTALGIVWSGSEGNGDGTESMASLVLNNPGGAIVLLAVATVTASVGVYLLVKACTTGWTKHLRTTPFAKALLPFVRYGWIAHGWVLLIVAGLIAWAAITVDPEKAGGLEDALVTLETQPFGRVLLFLTGAGLICFSVYCFVYAGYRFVPRLEDGPGKRSPAAQLEAMASSYDGPNAKAGDAQPAQGAQDERNGDG